MACKRKGRRLMEPNMSIEKKAEEKKESVYTTNTKKLLQSKTVRDLLNKLPDTGNKGGLLASIVGFLNLESLPLFLSSHPIQSRMFLSGSKKDFSNCKL